MSVFMSDEDTAKQYLLWTSNFRGILKQYCSLSSGIGALFVPFVPLFLWPIMWDVQTLRPIF